MKKLSKLALILMAVATFSACSNRDNNNNGGGFNPNGFAPNSCFNSGGLNQFRWANGTCIDSRSGQPTSPQFCQGNQMGFSNDQQCNFVGGFQIPGGQFGFGADACTQAYGFGWVTSRGMFGELICINAQTWGHISSFYGQAPILFNGMYQTCIPGGINNCRCQSFGGTLGWFQGGVSMGFCF